MDRRGFVTALVVTPMAASTALATEAGKELIADEEKKQEDNPAFSEWSQRRRILHIRVGDDNWEPSEKELQELANLFLDAARDPLGAVVATRAGVICETIYL